MTESAIILNVAPTIGLFAANMHAAADPVGMEHIARLAEGLGYDCLWVADHVVLPRPRVAPSPMEPDGPLLDPVVSLVHLAAHTTRIKLASGCIVLPQRNPLVLAKQLASVDVLSGGRLMFGVAVGYLEQEMRAVGVSPERRGLRTEEYLQAISSLWYDDKPAFHGMFVDFDGVDAHPRPVQRPVPVVLGGHSAAARRRAAVHAHEWFGFNVGLRATGDYVRSLRADAAAVGRDSPLRVSVSPARPLDPDTVRAYAELGVDRLVVVPPHNLPLDELGRFVERHAPARLEAALAPL